MWGSHPDRGRRPRSVCHGVPSGSCSQSPVVKSTPTAQGSLPMRIPCPDREVIRATDLKDCIVQNKLKGHHDTSLERPKPWVSGQRWMGGWGRSPPTVRPAPSHLALFSALPRAQQREDTVEVSSRQCIKLKLSYGGVNKRTFEVKKIVFV